MTQRVTGLDGVTRDVTYTGDGEVITKVVLTEQEVASTRYEIRAQVPNEVYPYVTGWQVYDLEDNKQCGWFYSKARAEFSALERNKRDARLKQWKQNHSVQRDDQPQADDSTRQTQA